MDLKKLISDRVTSMVDGMVDDIRRAMLDELVSKLGTPAGESPARPVSATPPAPEPSRALNPQSKIRVCIARLCVKQSKGPRFKYLCEDHIGASKKLIAEWKSSGASI